MIEGIGPVRARSLLEDFDDAPMVLAASRSALLRFRNIGNDLAEKISSWDKTVDLAGELKRISDFGCRVLIQSDENYPPRLREIRLARLNCPQASARQSAAQEQEKAPVAGREARRS